MAAIAPPPQIPVSASTTSTGLEQLLQIEAKNLTSLAPPALTIGDRIMLSVRQNPPGEQGLVSLRGLLIRAQLPPELKQGDKVNTEIIKNGERVIFKIIGPVIEGEESLQAKAIQQQPTSPVIKLEREFAEIFRAAAGINLQNVNTDKLAETLRAAGLLRGNIERLLGNLAKVLPEGERLFTPQEVIRELQRANTGGQIRVLRELAESIKQFVKENTPTPLRVQLDMLQDLFSRIIDQSSSNNSEAARSLQTLIADLQNSARAPVTNSRARADQEIARNLLQELGRVELLAQEKLPALAPKLQPILAGLQNQLTSASARVGALDPKTIEELTRLAGHLDSLASAQEAIERLNPLLQAIGEPAMILFPHLFQGLLSQTEVSVHAKKKRDTVEDEESKRGESQESYRRIQVSAPLPSLGTVQVDVAIRSKEILVSLRVEDGEVSGFLQSKLPELSALLREFGYDKTEFFTHVGITKEAPPEWAVGMHALRSIVA